MALLAHVLVLHGVPVAMCDYHGDFEKGYLHTAGESVDGYVGVCISQVKHLLADTSRRVVLVG